MAAAMFDERSGRLWAAVLRDEVFDALTRHFFDALKRPGKL
jgi:hypothetical protein